MFNIRHHALRPFWSRSPALSKAEPHLRRVLGRADLTFFLIAALVNLNSAPVVAGIGPGALVFWLAGFLLFFLPQAVAVLELSARLPQEGGIYQWNKLAFGPSHGFVSGWCYWANNIFYIPTLLLYISGFAVFIGGDLTAGLGDNPLYVAGLSLVLLWILTGLNMMGWGVGKWVQTIGASGTFITTTLIAGIAVAAVLTGGMANTFTLPSMLPRFTEWKSLALLSVVCLNFVGLELGSVVGEEIKDPRRTIPRAVLVAGIATVGLYLLATFAMLATVPAADIGVLAGILQGVQRAAGNIGVAWIVIPIAILMSLNAGGNASAWLAGSARVPFVIGLDRYFPSAFARLHPKYNTPYVAFIVQGAASSFFIVFNAVGSTVHDMYMILMGTTVVLTLIPYLYMFLALIVIRREPERFSGEPGIIPWSWLCYVAGAVGFLMTAFGVIVSFVPSAGIDDVGNFELKLVLGVLAFLVPALLVYRWHARRYAGVTGQPAGSHVESV
jgi:amino acid transporter